MCRLKGSVVSRLLVHPIIRGHDINSPRPWSSGLCRVATGFRGPAGRLDQPTQGAGHAVRSQRPFSGHLIGRQSCTLVPDIGHTNGCIAFRDNLMIGIVPLVTRLLHDNHRGRLSARQTCALSACPTCQSMCGGSAVWHPWYHLVNRNQFTGDLT